MNATTTTRKQTVGNNTTLAHLKRWLNAPLYKVAAGAMNAGGIEAVRAVLARHFGTEQVETLLTTDPAWNRG